MAQLLMVFVALSVITGTISVYIIGCTDGIKKAVEGYDDPWFTCRGILSSFSVINWTLVLDTGPTRQLAVCYSAYGCHANLANMYVGRFQIESSIQLRDVPQNFSGTLLCSEIGDYTEETASCRVDVVRVRLDSRSIRDFQSGLYTCYHAAYSPYTVTWTLTTDAGRTLHLGTCDETKQCTSPHGPAVQLRGYTNWTTAYINTVQRNMSGTLFCSYTYDGFTETDKALLEVYEPGTIDNCHVDIISHNWSAVLNCDVSRIFSTTGIYEFELYRFFTTRKTFIMYQNGMYRQVTGRLSFHNDLSPYIAYNKQYYRGRLSHSWKLSPDLTFHYQFRLNVYLGTYLTPYYFPKLFRIAKPTRPRLNCTDSSYIPEHEVLPCMCTADNLGLPSGRLIWLLGDNFTTGAYGDNQILLPSTAVTRRQEPILATCMLDWIEPLNATFLWNVAYGPDSVELQVSYFCDVNDTTHVLITCHVTELEPVSSSTVQWTGPCQVQAGFRCTVPLSVAEGKEVRCLVTNHANNGQSSEAVMVIKQHGRVCTQTHATQTQATQTQADISEFKWATYALGSALGIVAVVFVILAMFILGRRGHLSKCCGPVYDSPKRTHPKKNQSGDSTDLADYEAAPNIATTGN